MTEDSPPQLGSVVRDTGEIIGANWKTFLPAALLLVGLPSLVAGLGHLGKDTPLDIFAVLGGIATLIGGCALQGFIVYGASRDMDGSPATVAECTEIARKTWLPLLGLTLFIVLSVALGLVLLIVPGIIVALMWSMAAPALVLEGTDIAAALRRSAALTYGRRWKLLLIGIVVFVGLAIVEALLMIVPHALAHPLPLLRPVVHAALAVGGQIIESVLVTVLYKDLLIETV